MSIHAQESYASRVRKQYGDGRNLNARFELHRRFSTNPYGWTRWVFDQMRLGPQARVLELGCGTGVLWNINPARMSPAWHITLSDLSVGMLREARANLGEGRPQISYAHCDAQALPFGEDTFDAVVANHMLYHVEDRERAISEVARVLRPGAIFYATTNGFAHLRELDHIIKRFMPGPSPFEENAERFGLETGQAQMRRHFARVELRRYTDSLIVTEAQPLVEYAASSMRGMTEEALAAMRVYVEGQLQMHGSIQISKDAGMFISKRS